MQEGIAHCYCDYIRLWERGDVRIGHLPVRWPGTPFSGSVKAGRSAADSTAATPCRAMPDHETASVSNVWITARRRVSGSPPWSRTDVCLFPTRWPCGSTCPNGSGH